MHPAALMLGIRIDVANCFPESQGTVTDTQLGRRHASFFEIPEHFEPGFGAFPVPAGNGNQLFPAVSGGTHNYQHAESAFVKTQVEMDAINPEIAVTGKVHRAPVPFPVFFKPDLLHPADRG